MLTLYNSNLTAVHGGRVRHRLVKPLARSLLILLTTLLCATAWSAQWSSTELHLQYGDIENPFTQQEARTTILTFQHASGWQYGSNFYFIDYLQDDRTDGYQDRTFYAEWYSFLSATRLMGAEANDVIADYGLVLGVNAGAEAKVLKYLPGIQVNWKLPGFAFFNTLLTAYVDDNAGIAQGGAPKQKTSYMLDIAWRYPFRIAGQQMSVEGHAEYISGRDNADTGGRARPWILAQPQVRWDIGQALFQAEGQLFAGIEYQYWRNKLGSAVKESTVQALLVWRL